MQPQQRPFLALGLRLLAMLMLSGSLLAVKLSGAHGVALFQTMFWRQVIPAFGLFFWLAGKGQLHRIRTARIGLHVTRTITGTCGMVMTLGVVRILPLAEATILSFTTPIFAVLLATTFLREHVGPWRWSAVLLGLVGVIVIAGPDSGHIPLLGLGVGLAAAFFVALVSIQLREMGKTEEPIRVVFYFSALGTLLLSPAVLLTPFPTDLTGWLLMGGLGLTGLFAQLLLTTSLRYGSVSSVIVMDYSQLIWATLWGWLFFSQLPPSATWLGAPLVIASGLIIAWRERVLHQRPAIEGTTAPNAD